VVEPPLPKVVYHTVGKGESLSTIAEKHYGDERHWRHIYEANRQIIGANPDRLQPGMRLRIPSPEEIAGP
jgi:nucleoid-associated protein YgaU